MISKVNIGDECYDFRVRHNMTQDDFAALVGLNRVTVNYIECGRRKPAPYTAARLRLKMQEYEAQEKE